MINENSNTESGNAENSQPSKRYILMTMIAAVLLAFSFIALGIWWFTNN
ncbi:MAG: hypothetical protein LZF85_04530 [Nitrosomonas sp.]|nr:hypothetical protein [Nitrosomonas sp.]UJP03721.1 MAG: hypothetical protein LZF85_04530 [Nitrosomonas sp.]UJP08375.1 MAG: hypothetical protein LZF84_04545 [Nitrosomonas sp.]